MAGIWSRGESKVIAQAPKYHVTPVGDNKGGVMNKNNNLRLRLPQEVFICWRNDWKGDPVLRAEQNVTKHAVINDDIFVGVYKLEGVKKVTNQTTMD